jgi:hypothetical protein
MNADTIARRDRRFFGHDGETGDDWSDFVSAFVFDGGDGQDNGKSVEIPVYNHGGRTNRYGRYRLY